MELIRFDYLLKPISFERFLAAVGKYKPVEGAKSNIDTLVIKSGYDLHKVKLDHILYIESDGEYVFFHTPEKKIMSLQSLKSLEESLPKSSFMRVHRSFIVNINKVKSLIDRELNVSGKKIPVSSSYYSAVKNQLF